MSTRRIVVRGGHLLTMDPALRTIPQGDVLVEDGEITAVATSLPASLNEIAAGAWPRIQPDTATDKRR
jgi:cytosine/adenosine deaminase-related metal-dependent hydrolase